MFIDKAIGSQSTKLFSVNKAAEHSIEANLRGIGSIHR